jgi:spore coat protein U-like protein
MKKFLVSVIAATSAFAMVAPAHAVDLTPQFDVNITLNTGCKMSTAPTAVVFTYTALGAAATSTGGGFGVQCTKNLTYTMALDLTSQTDNATDLAYTLALSAAGGTGNGAAQPYTISGNMAAGQAGTCGASVASCNNIASTNKTRTLTVSY